MELGNNLNWQRGRGGDYEAGGASAKGTEVPVRDSTANQKGAPGKPQRSGGFLGRGGDDGDTGVSATAERKYRSHRRRGATFGI